MLSHAARPRLLFSLLLFSITLMYWNFKPNVNFLLTKQDLVNDPFWRSAFYIHIFGGMLAIDQSRAELRWLVQKPYNDYEPLRAALQSFPILIQPGGELGFPAEKENNARARRTVIAQDKQGRIIFIVAPDGYFTLHQ